MNPQSSVATPPAPAAPTSTSPPIAGNSNEALTQLQNTQAGQQKPLDILTAREATLGIPQAQQQVSGLRQAITNTTNLLNQVSPAVQGRTADSLVTSAQANKQIQNEQAPLNTNLQTEQQGYNQAQGDLQNLQSQASNEANLAVTGQQNDLSNLNSIYQNLFGGEKQQESVKEFNTQQAFQNQQLQENTRQFDVGQANQKEQFEKNLSLQTKQYDLSVEQQNELRREFDTKQATDAQQFAAQQSLAQQQLNETIRSNQANERISGSKATTTSNDGLGAALSALLGGGGNTSAAAKANAVLKNPSQGASGGYAFTNAQGAPISAASYASLSGQSLGNVLYNMGQNGDATAQKAYNAIKSTGSVSNNIKNTYSSLFWGT